MNRETIREQVAYDLYTRDWNRSCGLAYLQGMSLYFPEQNDFIKAVYLSWVDDLLTIPGLVFLADDQTLPECTSYSIEWEPKEREAYLRAQTEMIKAGFKKVEK